MNVFLDLGHGELRTRTIKIPLCAHTLPGPSVTQSPCKTPLLLGLLVKLK